jgi:eukaryotic-like serine/threonine-protein kinase
LAKDTRRRSDARGGTERGDDTQDDEDARRASGRGSTLWSRGAERPPQTERGRRNPTVSSSTPSHARFPQATFAEGSRFGPFVLGQRIGSGGMARVYQAEHQGLRRQVAIKVLIDGFARDVEERFLREARIAAAIKHPNVVNIFDVGLHQGLPYLVMELLEGEDLESLLRERGALDQETLIDIMVPIVAGLASVHDAGVVHRDLKPGNIFLARGQNGETEPKLLDFGISKAAWPEPLKLTSANGLVLGTPFYMSPEAVQGKEMTEQSDQYSLGVVLYECATGKNPFVTGTFAETVRLITTGDYPPASHEKPELSKRLVRIIERAMHLEPSERFASVRELGRELLLLAGQRTRITWGLSFGDPGALMHSRSTKPTRGPALAAPSQPSATGRHVSPLGLALVAVGVLGMLSLTLVLARRGSAPGESTAAHGEPQMVERALLPRPSASLGVEPREVPAAAAEAPRAADQRALVQRAPEPSAPAVSARPSGDDEPRRRDDSASRANVERDTERPRSAKRTARTRSESHETARRRTAQRAREDDDDARRDDGDEPGWWPPPAEPAPEPPRPQPVGANNAPIFD